MLITARIRRRSSLAVLPAAVIASALIIGHASYSAFSATTSNPTSTWSSGTVALSDDDSNTSMFSASALKPGSTGKNCIVVTSSGSLPSTVKLYGTNAATTNGLSSYINISIVQGTGGSSGNCSGFSASPTAASVFSGTLASFASTATSFSSGTGSWAPTGSAPESLTYQFTYTLDPSTPNTAQNGSASIGFTWEAQNS